ncbi:BTAD domain-containing putative transcriptional regulator [Streptomyces sp. enrichment culture]|uniref:AfsR/SARP family transcriptional regulator n=1 Tax=Streptomyces sp. enrichment culture TaxID=1795815 RepID=UPI003F54A71F
MTMHPRGATTGGPAGEPGAVGPSVRFTVLGPVRVWAEGVELPTGPRQQRLVLAALLARAGRPVSLEELVALLWEEDPPASAANAVHRYVGALRRLLEPGLPARAPGRWLVRRAGGYLLRVGPDELDLLAFRHLVRRARAATDADEAVDLFVAALEQWRGRCAADVVTADPVPRVFASVDHEYVAAVSAAATVALGCDRPGAVLLAARQAVERQPFNEQVLARTMLLLTADGKQAEALTLYHRFRADLKEELGLSPGRDVRAAYDRILREPREPGPPTANAGPVTPVATLRQVRPEAPVPHHPTLAQLPADLPCFTGRTELLEQAARFAAADDGALRVLAVDGIAGVGKTALAVHLAHRIAARFPDGQLFADLGGFASADGPAEAGEVLAGFLAALGVDRTRVPARTDARAALFRSVLATRRVLMVLDNAHDADQVRPLLPGSARCAVLITSRRRLTDLATMNGARLMALDVPSAQEAADCFVRRVGTGGPVTDAAAISEIVERCGRLPLALGIVAARATTYPDVPLRRIADELAAAGENLEAFSDNDRDNPVRAAFSWSYRPLGSDAARLFRALPRHGRGRLSTAELTRLVPLPAHVAAEAVAALVRARLLTPVRPDRYDVHPLVLAYAAELARESRRRTGVTRTTRAGAGRVVIPSAGQRARSGRAPAALPRVRPALR